jgi:hypothetical protein
MLEAMLERKQQKKLLNEAQEAAEVAAEWAASRLAFNRRMPLSPGTGRRRRDRPGNERASARHPLGETIAIRTSVESSGKANIGSAQLQNA